MDSLSSKAGLKHETIQDKDAGMYATVTTVFVCSGFCPAIIVHFPLCSWAKEMEEWPLKVPAELHETLMKKRL